ncbi:MAG TPA: E3 binding domain-containing protein, partial [Bacteroidales bacterium]|nr:E3 binding domain-containing protein [Bacteroidales bacterium]
MKTIEIVVPKLGESVIEATLTKWLIEEGAMITQEDPLVEIATDKVDSEIPSPFSGKLVKKLYKEGDVVGVGTAFALLEVEGTASEADQPAGNSVAASPEPTTEHPDNQKITDPEISGHEEPETASGTRFYSPLVRNIARMENVSFAELDGITGTGKGDRLTRQDLINYLKSRHQAPPVTMASSQPAPKPAPMPAEEMRPVLPGEDRIVEMDRIRQLIAGH